MIFGRKKRIEELEEELENLKDEISSLEEEKESFKERFEASEEKRKKLAREKQDREEKINKLENRLDSISNSAKENDDESDDDSRSFGELSFEEGKNLLEVLDSVNSRNSELISLFCNGDLQNVNDFKGLKNSLKSENYSILPQEGSYIYYSNNNVFNVILKTRGVFSGSWSEGNSFLADRFLDFVSEEKIWVLVSSGDSKVVREEDGSVEVLKRFNERVNRQHSKGGFSQGRFEKKREKQIKQHLENVEGFVEDLDNDNVYILSDRRHNDFLDDYSYLGGFEDREKLVDSIYNFRACVYDTF